MRFADFAESSLDFSEVLTDDREGWSAYVFLGHAHSPRSMTYHTPALIAVRQCRAEKNDDAPFGDVENQFRSLFFVAIVHSGVRLMVVGCGIPTGVAVIPDDPWDGNLLAKKPIFWRKIFRESAFLDLMILQPFSGCSEI